MVDPFEVTVVEKWREARLVGGCPGCLSPLDDFKQPGFQDAYLPLEGALVRDADRPLEAVLAMGLAIKRLVSDPSNSP